jgi:transmembrane sensor
MKKIDAGLLLDKYKLGTISDEELMMLESWYLQEIQSNKSYEGLDEQLSLMDKKFMFIQPSHLQSKSTLWKKIFTAASILVLLAAGFWFYNNRFDSTIKTDQLVNNKIEPGKNAATLTLSNGKKIKLTSAMDGKLAEETGVKISKTADGQIVYEIQPGISSHAQQNITNTLSTSNGETYTVRLPDGSLIVLNAASSLTYATNLNKLKTRSVTLSGEAYFEISKDKNHPFIVKTNTHEVEVLGTHFNINSYTNESLAKTTLIEGIVKIKPQQDEKNSIILKPGEQATLTPKSIVQVKKVDLEEVLAWKNGYFLFNDEEIESILKKVARWYNVDIKYESGNITERFNGMISREKSLDQVLAMLQKTDVVSFKIEGRRVIVR